MKFVIKRSQLLSAFKAVSSAVDKKNNGEDLLFSGVCLSLEKPFLVLKTTDKEIEIVTQTLVEDLIEPGTAVICFRKLSEIVRALPDGALVHFEKTDKMQIRSGKSRYVLSLLSHEAFPNFGVQTELSAFNLNQSLFRSWFDSVIFAIAEQDIRLYLNGLLLEKREDKLYAVASDGHRLALHALEGEWIANIKPFRILLPKKAILACFKLLDEPEGNILFEVGTRHFRLITGPHQLKGHLLEANFPSYERLIPSTVLGKLRVEKQALKSALNRVSALYVDRFKAVRLNIQNGNLELLAETPDMHDKMEENLSVQYEGEPLEAMFNIRYIMDCLQAIPEEQVIFTFTGINSSTLIQGDSDKSRLYLIMPMRV